MLQPQEALQDLQLILQDYINERSPGSRKGTLAHVQQILGALFPAKPTPEAAATKEAMENAVAGTILPAQKGKKAKELPPTELPAKG